MERKERLSRIQHLAGALQAHADEVEKDDGIKSSTFAYVMCGLSFFMDNEQYHDFVDKMTKSRDEWIEFNKEKDDGLKEI